MSWFARLALSIARASQALRSIPLLRFASRVWMPLQDEIVVIGGGLVGLELAEFLVERGRRVTVLEPGPSLGAELAIVRRARVLHTLREHGVTVLANTPVTGIGETTVSYEQDGTSHTVAARQVIIALGAEGDATLTRELSGMAAQVHRIGDCREVSYIDGAILSAREVVQRVSATATAAELPRRQSA